ncbi:MAG: DUF1329 domain-containing protein [Candidatus Binatia bacterium]|nr:DUF1329 domain-containing protein [Candidatus Binatia bacterium]
MKTFLRVYAIACFIVGCVFLRAGYAQERTLPTRTDIQHWIATHLETRPTFQEGAVLVQADLEKLRPFLPPRYLEEFDFPGVEFPISPTGNYTPHPDYMAATEQYSNQTRLAADGALEGYVAGRPFAHALLNPEDPQAGLKAAWNFNYRWQFYGMHVQRYLGALMAKGGTAAPLPGFPSDLIQGGGRVVRHLVALYQRVYHSHLAQLPHSNYTLPLQGAGEFEFKDYVEFLEPYDVRGSRFLVYRYEDPRKQDDAWGFLPHLRKVRRLSVTERDDAIGGTDMTLDDFTGFSGRVLDHQWKFLGWKVILHVMNSRHPYARFYGPNGWLPYDRWELRPCAVVEQIPFGERSYGSKIYFWDAQTYETTLVLVFDRRGTLWKVIDLLHGWSEDPTQPASDRGKYVPRQIGFTIIDVQKEQATVFSAYEITYPAVTASEISERYDMNILSEGKR